MENLIITNLMKNKLFIILSFFLIGSVNLNAQNYFFDKNVSLNSVEFIMQINKLTNSLEKDFSATSTLDSIEKRVYFDVVFEKHESALRNITLYRNTLSKSEWEQNQFFILEIFSKIKIYQDKRNINFDLARNKKVKEIFDNLSDGAFINLDKSFTNTQKLLIKTEDCITKIPTDSIAYNQAFNLIKCYVDYKVNLQIYDVVSEKYKIINNDKFIIQTKDIKLNNNVVLTTTIIKKSKGKKRLPVILSNSIYAGRMDTLLAKRAAIRDYVGVVVNTRGKRSSLNENYPFEFESKDIYEVVDWISKQKWSNKKVGMIGGSYLGFSQWSATKKLHPALKTIVPQVSVGIGTIDFPMSNNVFMNYSLMWINYVTNNKLTDEVDFNNYEKWNNVYEKWFKNGMKYKDLDSISGLKSKVFQKWLSHPSYDEYWQKMVPYKNDFSQINIPILTTTGYYDGDQIGALYYLREHYKYNKNPNHYLVIGPYNHSSGQHYTKNVLYGYTLDAVARVSMSELGYDWIDYIIKKKKKPELLQNKINFQVMNTNKWIHVENLEKTSNKKIKFYLENLENSKSVFQKPIQLKSFDQSIDFKNREDNEYYYHVSKNDSIQISRNTLVFVSENIDKDLVVSGSFEAKINVLINKKDFDFNIKFMQIQPIGELFNLSSFNGRASYLEDKSNRKLLVPNQKETLIIDNSKTMFVSKKIEKGSKLILFVEVNFNKYEQINYGTGLDVSEESIKDATEPLQIRWYNDSYIEIPIID